MWEHRTALFIIHVLGWPLSELKRWMMPEWCLWSLQIELLLFGCFMFLFFSGGGVSFAASYKDGTICKSSSNGTLEGSALCLSSLLSGLCLVWEETGQLHSSAFLLVFWPWFSDVFTCVPWRSRSPALGSYSKKRVCPFAFGWKVWSLAVAHRPRKERAAK